MVTKILFKNKRAIGVQLSREGVVSEVFADAEIILSAGSIQSPQILQLSGIGPGNCSKTSKLMWYHNVMEWEKIFKTIIR